MQRPFALKCCFILTLYLFTLSALAQPGNERSPFEESGKNAKPYRILTTGKQITIRSSKNMKSLMVWTSGGHRIVEEKNLDVPVYQFRITVPEKIFFVMVQLTDGRTYSEKIGVQ